MAIAAYYNADIFLELYVDTTLLQDSDILEVQGANGRVGKEGIANLERK